MGRCRTTLVVALCAAAALAAAPAAQAGPGSSTTAIVSMGDSFVSGESARWQGNSLKWWGDRDGTDRAARCYWWGCDYDARRVYGSSFDNECDRADVAEIKSTPGISVNERTNIACSGAQTKHIWRASQGGQTFKGEAPQADQLATIAQQKNVKMVVLAITANDLGFSDHVINCTATYIVGGPPCNAYEQWQMEQDMPAARAGLRKAIDEIRAVMSAAGYSSSQWRFVIHGYSSPVPKGSDIRYPENGSRTDTGGCPFYNVDADWAKNTATPYINDNMKAIAREKGVQYMDYRDALNGHEVCHKSSSLVSSNPPNAVSHEWVRWLNSGCCQGEARESLHPNAYGHKALGRCLELIYAKSSTSGDWTCKNTAGQTHTGMKLVSLP